MNDVAVIVPVLGRPDRAAPLAANLADTAPDTRLVFVCSPKDEAQIAACDATGAQVIVAWWEPGHADFALKVNLAYQWTAEPWLFQAADDVRFEPGWLDALMECAASGALVVGTDDGGNPTVRAGKHSTHTLVARSYCDDPGASWDGPGSVFSTAYGHAWCDTELVELAKWRGVWGFCPAAVVTHLHPFWSGRPRDTDPTYEKGRASYREDSRLYRQRERLWRRTRATA